MKTFLKNIAAIVFLLLFLPYTITLLANGREGIRQEKQLSQLEYRVIDRLLSQDFSGMEEEMLRLMAVLYRTELVRLEETTDIGEFTPEIYGSYYEHVYEAVSATEGQVVQIDGVYRELPYHAVSAGCTRTGTLLGEDFFYIYEVECPKDKESAAFFQMLYLTEEEMIEALGVSVKTGDLILERDRFDYVTQVQYEDFVWTGERFREILHLPSSCFWLEAEEESIRVTVKGSGHGFGISLYTANWMAEAGADYEDILKKFYKNAECITIP